MEYHYSSVLPIESYTSTPWMVEFENGCKQLHLWHKKAKIEDIVDAVKMTHPGIKFTVAAFDVGVFTLHHIDHAMSNGRKLNQDMCVVVS